MESVQLLQLQLVSFRLEPGLILDLPTPTTGWCRKGDTPAVSWWSVLASNLRPTPRTELEIRGCEKFSEENPWLDIFITL